MINEYQTQSQLNPALWDGDKLKPKLRLQLLKIAKYFYKFLVHGVHVKVKDVTLTGSNANYNWTDKSDIDLHIIINYKDVPGHEDATFVRDYMMAKKTIWNNKYPLMYKGMRIELYAQDQNEPHASSGVYSVLHDTWLMVPNSEMISIEDEAIDQKAKPYEYEIDKLDPDDDQLLDKITSIKARLKTLRQSGLQSTGEYSLENLAFKSLRNSGHLERLSNLEQTTTFRQLTPGVYQ